MDDGAAAGRPDSDPAAPWWKCVVAALPEFAVAIQFLLAQLQVFAPGVTRRGLTSVMQVELLVIHSIAFLGMIALWQPAGRSGRVLRALLFWGVCGIYVAFSIGFGRGYDHLLMFPGLTLVTYLGLFMSWNRPGAVVQLGARWLAAFLIFIVASGVAGAPRSVDSWTGDSRVLVGCWSRACSTSSRSVASS